MREIDRQRSSSHFPVIDPDQRSWRCTRDGKFTSDAARRGDQKQSEKNKKREAKWGRGAALCADIGTKALGKLRFLELKQQTPLVKP